MMDKEKFNFKCQMTGNCCYKMEIFLNPFDILQIASALGTSTTETIDRYLLFLENRKQGFPRPIFKAAREGFCSFNIDKKCTIHQNRPLSCRLFPLAKKKNIIYNTNSDFCLGLKIGEEISLQDYLLQEGAGLYIVEADSYYKLMEKIMGKTDFSQVNIYLKDIFYLVLYDIDKVFNEYSYLKLSSMEKLALSLNIAEYIAENYFPLKEYSKEELLENIFIRGDQYIAENIKK